MDKPKSNKYFRALLKKLKLPEGFTAEEYSDEWRGQKGLILHLALRVTSADGSIVFEMISYPIAKDEKITEWTTVASGHTKFTNGPPDKVKEYGIYFSFDRTGVDDSFHIGALEPFWKRSMNSSRG